MGSEQSDGTSYSPSEPKLCANGCGFFGTAANMDLCSKCYRDLRVEEAAKAAMEKSLNMKAPKLTDQTPELATVKVAAESSSIVDSASASQQLSVGLSNDQPVPEPKGATRCLSCDKKVGLTGFKCKCGSTFCGIHRYPEKHDCTFDFKVTGRDAIAKANPLVKADKLVRI